MTKIDKLAYEIIKAKAGSQVYELNEKGAGNPRTVTFTPAESAALAQCVMAAVVDTNEDMKHCVEEGEAEELEHILVFRALLSQIATKFKDAVAASPTRQSGAERIQDAK